QGTALQSEASSERPVKQKSVWVEAEGGYQKGQVDASSPKFLEFQDIGEPVALTRLGLRVRRWDTDFFLGSIDAFEKDAMYWVGAARPGLFGVRLGWDRLPHELSDTALTLHRLSHTGDQLLVDDRIQRAD